MLEETILMLRGMLVKTVNYFVLLSDCISLWMTRHQFELLGRQEVAQSSQCLFKISLVRLAHVREAQCVE